MKKKKEPYPSQLKYHKNNPAVSFRLNIEDKILLDELIKATGKPLSKWMKDFLHNKTNNEIQTLTQKIKTADRIITLQKEKIKELQNIERFSIPCSKCGKPINLNNQMSNWETKIKPRLKREFSGFHHVPECPKKRF